MFFLYFSSIILLTVLSAIAFIFHAKEQIREDLEFKKNMEQMEKRIVMLETLITQLEEKIVNLWQQEEN